MDVFSDCISAIILWTTANRLALNQAKTEFLWESTPRKKNLISLTHFCPLFILLQCPCLSSVSGDWHVGTYQSRHVAVLLWLGFWCFCFVKVTAVSPGLHSQTQFASDFGFKYEILWLAQFVSHLLLYVLCYYSILWPLHWSCSFLAHILLCFLLWSNVLWSNLSHFMLLASTAKIIWNPQNVRSHEMLNNSVKIQLHLKNESKAVKERLSP